MLVGVLSDTHIPTKAGWLPDIVENYLRKTSLIIHAGDIADGELLEYLETLAPVKAVMGNMDPPELKLPKKTIVEIEDFKIGIIHGDGIGGTTVERAAGAFDRTLDCIVFGHSHQAYQKYHDKTLMFNPGSPTDRRRGPRYSFGLLDIAKGTLKASIVYF